MYKDSREAEKFEKLFAEFKKDYANADETTKRDLVNALLGDVALQLENYIHRRNKPKDVSTGTVLSRSYESVAKFFIKGSGDPDHYQTGAQFILLLKRVVSQSICARIRQYVREHGGDNATIVSLDRSDQDDDAPKFQIESTGNFTEDLARSELLALLCQEMAKAQLGESSRLSYEDSELLELRFTENMTLQDIVEYYSDDEPSDEPSDKPKNITEVRRRLARIFVQLQQWLKELGLDQSDI